MDTHVFERTFCKLMRVFIFPLLVAALVFSISYFYALSLEDPVPPLPYSPKVFFYPSIFYAAGFGMGTADISTIPSLEDYVYGHKEFFDIANVPADCEVSPLTTTLELTHLYALYAVGIFYRCFGVSTATLIIYAAFLRAVCAVAVYFILRFGLSPWSSLIGTLLTGTAPAMLFMGIAYRDFGRAPFILMILAGTAFLLHRPRSNKALLGTAVFLGAVAGIGFGFRPDVLIAIPPVLIVLFFFVRLNLRHPWAKKALAAVIIFLSFLLTAFPVMRGAAMEGGQAMVHPILIGMSPESEESLHFGGASYDSLIATDVAAYAIVSTYAQRMGNLVSMVNMNSSEYHRASGDLSAPLLCDPFLYYNGANYARYGRRLFGQLILTFPADLIARAWRAAVAFYDMPTEMHRAMEAGIDMPPPRWLQSLLACQGKLALHLSRFGLLYTGTVITISAMFSLRIALCLTLITAWFTGYSSLLYEPRHFFFLLFIPVFAMMVIVEKATVNSFSFFRRLHAGSQAWKLPEGLSLTKRVSRVILFLGLIGAIILVPLVVARVWQRRQIHNMIHRLCSTSLEEIPVTKEIEDGRLIIQPETNLPGLAESKSFEPGHTAWEYVALVVNTMGKDLHLTIHYETTTFLYDFTQSLWINGINDHKTGKVTLYFPIYEADMSYGQDLMAQEILKTFTSVADRVKNARPVSDQEWWHRGKFVGVSLSEEHRGKVNGFYRVTNLDNLPLLPIFQVPENLQHIRSYKFGPWERKLRGIEAKPLLYEKL